MNADPTGETVGTSESHWGTHDPEAQPPAEQVKGLPRLVIETHTRLGPKATPEQVVEELRGCGIDTTVEEVRSLWSEGGNATG